MELKTKPTLPTFHQPEDLVLLINADETATAGTFQIVPQNPDAPQAPFSFTSPITPDDQALLSWYIEESHVRRAGTDERANRAEQLVRDFGRDYFHQLFSRGAPLYDWWHEASQRKSGRIVIVSDSPIVHRVHWELLRDETEGMPAFDLGIRIVRKLQTRATGDHSDSSLSLPGYDSKIRILVVRPRPKTAHLQLPGGSIWDELRKLDTIVVEECTPPTLEHLSDLLHAARTAGRPFAIVHFDGHGVHTDGQGALVFEDEYGNPDIVDGDRLGTVFRGVPVVVLDACRTAATEGPAWEAVAPLLLRLGVRSVIAMPYAAHIDMLRRLFDRFYRELASGQTMSAALDEARRAILVNQSRRPQQESKPVENATIRDWWVPQLFQAATDHALLVDALGAEAPPVAAGSITGGRHPRRKRPIIRGIGILVALLLIVMGLWEAHRRPLDDSLKERSRVNDDCANGNNPNQCAAALELNNDCCKNHLLDWSQCCYRAGLLHEAEKPPQLAAAAQSYEESCDAHPPEPLACLNLGILYQTGSGVLKKDLRKAINLFTIACYAGISRSCSNAGRTYLMLYQQAEQRPDFDMAKQFLDRACAAGLGDPGGCTALGKWYDLNEQPAQAFKMYRLACNKKDAIGCAHMGDIASDVTHKVEYYQHACAMNDEGNGCPGCIQLAQVYASGQVGKLGPRDASARYKDLCDRGCGEGRVSVAEACRRLADDFRDGTAGRVRDLSLAAEYYQKGCDGLDGVSCGWLGYLRQATAPEDAARLFSQGCTLGARSSCCMASQLAAAQGDSTVATHFKKQACELDLQCCAEFD